jgi:hypothetical protein
MLDVGVSLLSTLTPTTRNTRGVVTLPLDRFVSTRVCRLGWVSACGTPPRRLRARAVSQQEHIKRRLVCISIIHWSPRHLSRSSFKNYSQDQFPAIALTPCTRTTENMTTNTFKPCCVTGFQWDGTPEGREEVLNGLPTYVTGSNPERAVLYVHDALGWRWKNARLLADCYAREVGACSFETMAVLLLGWRKCLFKMHTIGVLRDGYLFSCLHLYSSHILLLICGCLMHNTPWSVNAHWLPRQTSRSSSPTSSAAKNSN